MVLNVMLESLESAKIFGLDFFHAEDFVHLLSRFAYNLFWVFIPSYFLYFKRRGDKEYFFTFMIASIIVFQICMLLGTVSLRIGFALGLFAIFGILRYRTNPIPPREMTYLFMVIGMSVKNSLANENISLAELLVTDLLTVLVAFSIELYLANFKLIRKSIVYDRTDLIKPDKYEELLKDLSNRFGVTVEKADIGSVDLIKDQVRLMIYFQKVNGIRYYDSPKD
ncbi:MAG TPA: DUF4956 domain-containing protein [Bacteroidales bacterium]|nr:DUF4956 domain-containing protein [Bacteroidales bacterium]